MKVGTKSLLFGVHQIFIHPWFVARGWIHCYGWPKDIRIWVAFFVHDLGYWGKADMDGKEGESHPYLGARLMHKWFDGPMYWKRTDDISGIQYACFDLIWYDFTLYHSRFLAKQNNKQYSRLCVADKAAIYLTPKWLYIFLGRLSGEMHEYLGRSKYNSMNMDRTTIDSFHHDMCEYLKKWVSEHKELKEDKWTGIK